MKKYRELIDIEDLLVRAYREKRVHTLQAGAGKALGLTRPRAPGATFSTSDKVDTSSYAARMAAEIRELQARLGAAPSSLIDLHDAVLALPDFYIERGADLDFVVWDVETATAAGHRITVDKDRGSTIVRVTPRGSRCKSSDALTPSIRIGEPRRLVPLVTAPIMVLAGRSGERPYVPDVVAARRWPIYKGHRKQAVGYVYEYETPLDAVVEARAAYAVWHAALGMLAARLAGSAEYEVTGPVAPVDPWKAPARILPALVDAAPAVSTRKQTPAPCKTRKKPIVAAA